MAQVIFKCLGGKAEIHADAVSPKDAFKKLALLQEMCSETNCGCCNSDDIAFSVRPAQNAQGQAIEYYEMKCNACNAKLSFGQHADSPTLFAKRWDKEARAPMPNGGWHVYVPQGGGGDGGYQQPQQGGGYPQQGGAPQQQGGWGNQQQRPPRQQPPQQMNPPPQQTGNDIPFLWLAPFIGITTAMIGLMV